MSTINVLKTVLSAEDQGFSRVMRDAGENQREFNKMMKQSEEVYKSTRTPLEQYEAGIAKLSQLLKRGAIDQETFNRASKDASDAFRGSTKGIGESLAPLNQVGGTLGSITQGIGKFTSAFASGNPVVIGLTVALAGFAAAALAAKLAMDVLSATWDRTVQSFEGIDAVDDAAGKIGVATEALMALRYAAGYSGIAANTLDSAIGKMNVNIGKAARDGGATAEAFERIGLSAADLRGAGTEEAFGMIADAISALPNEMDQATAAQEIFGKSGRELLPILREGSAGIEEWTSKGRKLGVVLSEIDAIKVVQANDAVQDLKAAWEGVGNALATEVAPVIKAVSVALLDLGTTGGDIGDQIKFGFDVAVRATANLINALDALNKARKLDFGGLKDLAGNRFLKELEEQRIQAEAAALREQARRQSERRNGGLPPGVDAEDDDKEPGKSSKKSGKDDKSPIDELQKEADRLKDELRTPQEKFQDELNDLSSLFNVGAIDMNTLNRAMAKAEADFEKATHKGDDKKATKEQTEINKELERIDKLKESLRTPREKFEDAVNDLNKDFIEGLIDNTTFDRALKDAEKTRDQGILAETGHSKKEEKKHQIEALEKGSKEAFSAINRARGGGAATGSAADIARKQLEVQKRQEQLQREMNERMKPPKPVQF